MTTPAPDTLSGAGRKVWDDITAKYDLRPDELEVLEAYCWMKDEIASLKAEHVELGRPTMTKGSMGQLVEHPIPKRIADLEMKRAALARQLKLPDDGTATGIKTNAQREGGNARWANAHGA